MPELIACLSTGKGTWGHVSRLIDDGKFDKVYLITNEFGQENCANHENEQHRNDKTHCKELLVEW